ncbi:MAG TPA: hypothetical protein GXX14_05540 [Clostridiaceae bacterium]|nr:hypothetical protein [Clostridiaceae bacterium]
MYSSANKQYVFKKTDGTVINLFHDNRYGLCCSMLTKRNTWTEPVSLHKNVYNSFYADMDEDDQLHVFFQDLQGNLYYTKLDNEEAKTTPILNSKSVSSYDKHLYLVAFKNAIHFFFALKYNNSNILSHQILSSGNIGTPRVIDYISESSHPYSVEFDRSGNLYAFYQLSDNKYTQIGYKKYTPSQKNWGEFIPITRSSIDSEMPRTIIDYKDIIHLIYQRHSEKQYQLVYQQKIPDKNMWTEESVIHTSVYPFDESSIIMLNKDIIIFWVRSDAIYFSVSYDNGNTWSKPARYNFPVGKQLICLGYKVNKPYQSERMITKTIPGSFINGLKIAFYQESPINSENLSANELKNMIVESLKMLKGNVEELRDEGINAKESILQLETLFRNLEKEVVKNSLKLNMLEREISRLKQLESRLQGMIISARSEIESKLGEKNANAAVSDKTPENNINKTE